MDGAGLAAKDVDVSTEFESLDVRSREGVRIDLVEPSREGASGSSPARWNRHGADRLDVPVPTTKMVPSPAIRAT